MVKSWAAIIGPIKTAVCHDILTIEFAFNNPSFSICVGKYALKAGTIGRPNALWKKANKTKIQIDSIWKKNKIGIIARIIPCIIVEKDIILVLGNKSTTAPMNSPHNIAGRYVVIATNPVIFSELVKSSISQIKATS